MFNVFRVAVVSLPALLVAGVLNVSPSAAPDEPGKKQPPAPAPKAPDRPEAKSPVESARGMQPLKELEGVVTFPLADGPTAAWRPVRDGVALKPGRTGIGVSYTRARGKPAGAALVFKPGALSAKTQLTLAFDSSSTTNISICLTMEDGSVWSLNPVRVSVKAVEVQRAVADAEWDPYQNGGRAKVAFDPSKVYMVTLLDLGGFMGGAESDFAWTVTALKGVRK